MLTPSPTLYTQKHKHTHTQNRTREERGQLLPHHAVYLRLQGAVLYSATISPSPSPLGVLPRYTPRRVTRLGASNPQRGPPSIDRQPRNIGTTLSLSLNCSAFQPFRAPPRRLTSSAYSLIATIQLYLVHIDVKKKKEEEQAKEASAPAICISIQHEGVGTVRTLDRQVFYFLRD